MMTWKTKLIAFAACIVCVLLALNSGYSGGLVTLGFEESRGPRPVAHGMALVGHRGASAQKPENTLTSLRQAWGDGAHGVEFDLQQLADGTLVMLHDSTLRRTATSVDGLRPKDDQQVLDTIVDELTWESVLNIGVGGERLKRFEEVLQEVRKQPPSSFCLVDLKVNSSAALVREVIRTAQQEGTEPRQLAFVSFDADICVTVKRGLPAHDVLLIAKDCFTEIEALQWIDKAERLGLSGVDFFADPRVVTREVVRVAHERGLLVGVWCPRFPAPNDVESVWSALYLNGADMFTSNLPVGVHEWAAQTGAMDRFPAFWAERHRISSQR